jgi:hypothetical protein
MTVAVCSGIHSENDGLGARSLGAAEDLPRGSVIGVKVDLLKGDLALGLGLGNVLNRLCGEQSRLETQLISLLSLLYVL